MKSSTSQRAGISRTFLYTMYLTRGAKVSTRRSRTARSSVRRYSFHRARVSSEDSRRLEVCAVARLIRRCSLVRGDAPCIGTGPNVPHPRYPVSRGWTCGQTPPPQFWGGGGSNLHRVASNLRMVDQGVDTRALARAGTGGAPRPS